MRYCFLGLAISLLAYSGSFSSYFSQDDFFHLKYSQAASLKEFLNFFNPLSSKPYAFYRPLARESYNFLMYRLFYLNPLPYHIVGHTAFAIFLCSAYRLLVQLTRKPQIAGTAIVLYSLSAIHLGTFYYLSSIQILFSAIFTVLSVSAFLSGKKWSSITLFLLGLLSHELSYTTPFLLYLVRPFRKEGSHVVSLKPFIALAALFVSINTILIKLPTPQEYVPSFSITKYANNFVWYTLWAGGLPEFLIDYVQDFRINPKAILLFPSHFWTMTVSACVFVTVLLIRILGLSRDNSPPTATRIGLLGAAWFVISISPMLILPAHKFIYYLILPLLGTSLFLSSILDCQDRMTKSLLVVAFVVLNLNTITLGAKTYWPIGRGKTAFKLLTQIKTHYPSLEKGSILYIRNDPAYITPSREWGGTAKQANIALSGEDAFQLLYQDPLLRVYYEDTDQPPEQPYFEHIARL